ncbi:hypothetical protein G7Y89_g5472 [Cudoniella acicularis]|uniref:Heterokaryon incompatibility domain-containing protein n=1 Tax=Cudoniella acicularis TaxID=354080 RepID=A0A8H4W3Y7_9HELO|nr:hypothetical protein G7Y89_g5472 [Cudoniella acicularis]
MASSGSAENHPDGGSEQVGRSVISQLEKLSVCDPSWAAHLCSRCASMTSTAEGLRDLISPQGYTHHIVSDLEQSAGSGCSFCASIFSTLSRGHLYPPDPDGQRVRVGFEEMVQVRASISAYYEEKGRYSKHGLSNAPILMLQNVTVDFIYKGRKCLFHIPVPGMPFYKSKILAFQVFADISDPFYICGVEVAGNRGFVSFDRRPLRISVTNRQMIEASKRLLDDCVTNHSSTCPSEPKVLLPSRVIDVNSDANQEGLSLHICAPDERGCYAALSYCWGYPPPLFVTTRSTLEDLSKIDWSQLPPTIKDAVTVTRGLGIRFLWVDALCIVQDDEADKTEQIKVMGRIYKTAAVTIAAASAASVHEGFLEDRPVPSIPFPISKFGTGDATGKVWIHENTIESPDEPLDKRGWTLQESLLSPRILYYGSKDLIWKCQAKPFLPVISSHNLYSTNNSWSQIHRLPPAIFIPSETATSVSDCWAWIQSAYSQLKLSLAEDRYRALGGIVEELQRVTGDIYIAGVWKNNIARSLAWFRSKNVVKEAAPYTPPPRPSWSWLPRFYPARTMDVREDDDKEKRVQLLNWSVKLADEGAPFGHVEGAELEVSACIIQTTKIPSEIWTDESSVELMLDFDIADESVQLSANFVGEQYYYLLLGNCGAGTGALLLQSLGDNSFIRLGISALNGRKSAMWSFEDVQRMKIRFL